MTDRAGTGSDGLWATTRQAPAAVLERAPASQQRASTHHRIEPSQAGVTAVGLAIGVLIVVSTMVGSSGLEFLVSFIAIAASVISPLVGMTVLAFVAPVARPLVIPPPGLYVVMMSAMVFGLVLRLPIDRPRLRRPSAEVLLLGAFVVYVAVELLGGRLDGNAGPRATAIASLFARLIEAVLALGVAYVVLRGRSPFPVLTALLLSAVLGSVVALSQAMGASEAFGNLIEPAEGVVRVTGAFDDPNYLGTYLASMIVLALACLLMVRSPWLKAALLATSAIMSVTLILTQSRGALAAIMVGLVVIAFMYGRRIGLMTIAGLVLIVAGAYPAFSEWRFGEDGASARALTDTAGRTDAWWDGLELFSSSPLFGIGFGRFQEEASVGIAAHNWYVQVLAELGLAGFVLWCLFNLAIILALARRPWAARLVGYPILAVWMIASLSLSPPTAFVVSGPVLIAVAVAVVADWGPRGPATESPGGRTLVPIGRPPRHARPDVDHPAGIWP